jgi:hypothetical protein
MMSNWGEAGLRRRRARDVENASGTQPRHPVQAVCAVFLTHVSFGHAKYISQVTKGNFAVSLPLDSATISQNQGPALEARFLRKEKRSGQPVMMNPFRVPVCFERVYPG